jgi:hypothetical protein
MINKYGKYIHIEEFIKLSRILSNSEILTYFCINLKEDPFKSLDFYSKKQIKNNLTKLKMLKLTNMSLKSLTSKSNNLFKIEHIHIRKYKKDTILYYKYKIFELFCKEYILVKQEQLQRHLNITQRDIKKFKKRFELNSQKYAQKSKNLTKYYIGFEDINIQNSNFCYTLLPNYYVFYKLSEDKNLTFKTNYNYIKWKRNRLAFGYNSDEYGSQKSASTDNVDMTQQVIRTYTKVIEDPRKFHFHFI